MLRLGDGEFVERLQQYSISRRRCASGSPAIDYVDLRFDERLVRAAASTRGVGAAAEAEEVGW